MNAIPETLPAFLAQHVNNVTPALIDRGRPVSFRELAEESRRIAQGLRGAGVQPGDCVALWLPNVPAWLATFLACAQLGAVAVSVNTRFRSHELADILQRSRSRVLVFWPGFKGIDFAGILGACDPRALEHLERIVAYGESGEQAPATMLGKSALSYLSLAAGAPLLESRAAPEAGCAIFTTSGTTRAPKFVLHDQRTAIRHAFDVVKGFSIGPGSALLLAPPLCGVFGFCSAMAGLAAGCPIVMAPSWNAEQAARDIIAHRVTHINGTDEAAAQLLDIDGLTFADIRYFGYAAFNPAQAAIVERADARSLKLVGLYGASEIQALFSRQDEDAPMDERMPAGGRPVSPGARARSGIRRELGGFLVSPAEIEAAVQEAPGIAACQVVAIPRAEGLVPVAFVILQQGASLDETAVIARVASRLARYKVPRRVFPVDAFPVTPGANATKIQKGRLREMAEALLH